MKTSVITLVIAAGIITGAVIYLNRQKTPATPAPVAQTTPPPAEQAPPEKIPVGNPTPPPTAPTNAGAPVQMAAAAPADVQTNALDSTNSLSAAVDALLTAHGQKKHDLFQQLLKNGQLDAAIADLQQRAATNSTDPEIPTTLGEALLNKLRGLHDAGADNNQQGILALQADEDFNNALKIDPKNWEAQFVKVSSMSYWPSTPQTDNDLVQRLSSLIDEQEGMQPTPIFAQTYVLLGNQYQKMGRQAEAIATWQLGAQRFPADPTLQQKLSAP
jgi:tetratricopeptide (TPR) repeat protein